MVRKLRRINWQTVKSFSALELVSVPVILILLALARIVILTIPSRYYYDYLGENKRTLCYTPLLKQQQIHHAHRIGLLIRAVASRTPWESKCLVQAIVARCLLGLAKIPYGLFFGVANRVNEQGEKEMKAHAWVCAGSVSVTGGYSWHQFSVVMSYYSPYNSRKVPH